jgi:hypothetical protein
LRGVTYVCAMSGCGSLLWGLSFPWWVVDLYLSLIAWRFGFSWKHTRGGATTGSTISTTGSSTTGSTTTGSTTSTTGSSTNSSSTTSCSSY